MIRIGYVKYLNTLPLVHGLDAWREAELCAAVPAKLAGMLTGDAARDLAPQIDIGLVSLIDFARTTVPLTLIPAGMIGCDGPTLTVRLFSAVPLDHITTVHADTDSHTSAALAQLILAHQYDTRVTLVDFDARERTPLTASTADSEWPETLLMIGDKVVTDSPPAVRYPHQLDLGEAWKSWTGLPFVYAMWMCRAADAQRPDVLDAAGMLDRQRRRNTLRLDWAVDRFAADRAWPADLARTYLGRYLRYQVGPREQQAVHRFLTECAALNLAPAAQPRWLTLEPAAAING